MALSDNTSAALKYAEKGKPIFPCNLEKQPITSNGFKDATTESDKVRAWWKETPTASIGMATGKESSLWVLDVDLPDGPGNLDALEKEYGALPATLTQETGGGGYQFFFEWPGNGTEIRNSAGKISKDIDVRGNGGYVIMPPSPHPSGTPYKWLKSDPPVPAPTWLINLVKKQPEKKSVPMSGINNAYGQKAMANEIVALSCAGDGERNDQLNRSAYSLGQLIAGGQLDISSVENALRGVATGLGLKSSEIEKTIASGIKSGMNEPRYPQNDYDYEEFNGQIGQDGQIGQYGHQRTESDSNGQATDKTPISTDSNGQATDKKGGKRNETEGLKNTLKAWILMDKRQFRIQDAYNDLDIRNRQQKKNVSDYLSNFCDDGLIERVNGQRGVFLYKESVCSYISFIDMGSKKEMDSIISLPLGLEDLGIQTMPGNIMVVAGESNAGKTSLLLNIAKDNLKDLSPTGKFDTLQYFSSEMGPQELHNRVKAFQEPMPKWVGMKAIERTGDFHQVIDPDGLNIIDFMEVHNEFYLVGEWIRRIHETLNDGVCVIALQKKSGSDFGRSGEISLEKPRLYLSISEVIKGYSACKIVKAKNYIAERNPNGLEKDFRVTNRGAMLDELTDWRYVQYAERKKINQGYELLVKQEYSEYAERSIPGDETAYTFHVDGDTKRVTFRQVQQWRESYKSLDVDECLKGLSDDSFNRPFLTKNWFFQVSGILGKKHKNITGE